MGLRVNPYDYLIQKKLVSIYPKAEMGLRVGLDSTRILLLTSFNLPEGRDGFKSALEYARNTLYN